MTDTEQMSGAQIALVARKVQEVTRHLLSDLELRKLALSTACNLVDRHSNFSPESFIAFADAMHKFLTAAVDAQGASDK